LYTFVRWNYFFTNPPLCITDAELREGIEIIDRALAIADYPSSKPGRLLDGRSSTEVGSMKKHASVVCMMALASHIGVRPSLAAGAEPPHAAARPLAAAISTAGTNFSRLLSQTGSNRISAGRELKIALAAAIGFGAGFACGYFSNEPLETRMGLGTIGAVVAGVVAYQLTGP
jgi:hypothetical protein